VSDKPQPIRDQPNTAQFEAAYGIVASLIKSFLKGAAHYVDSGTYQESEVRTDFIDKFFTALGWDVNHDLQRDPYRQEVKIEKTTNDSGKADYAFALAPHYGRIRFLVEAKRPQANILSEDNCFQTIRYGWPLALPICVLTDFNYLHVLDTRFRPNINSAVSRVIKSWSCTDLLDKDIFAQVYWLLARDAVADNSIDRFAEDILPAEQAAARQYSLFAADRRNFDDDFLNTLEEWREQLARTFKKTRPDLDGRQLTEIVQRTLDRLIFIRFLEDKQIEQQPIISHFGQRSKSHWQDFTTATKRLDQIYNGIIFKAHFILDDKAFQPSSTAFELHPVPKTPS
jgi:adenine-specific DNA-methyltransferase